MILKLKWPSTKTSPPTEPRSSPAPGEPRVPESAALGPGSAGPVPLDIGHADREDVCHGGHRIAERLAREEGDTVSAIVPRWEWRGFGEELRDVESFFGGVSSKRVEESDEIYVLSVRGTDAVKFRNELMDVKHLLEVNDDGLEQWVPVMKTGFPVSATDVGSVLRALRVDAQSSRLARAAYTLPEFLDDVVGPHPDLLAVEVHKRRERYTVGGCMAEVSEISTGHGSTHTVAIESEDAKRVIQTVRDVGLASRPNVSLVRGLKAMVGFGVERFAVVDVGTNSVKFDILSLIHI